jgi:YjbE family integral membrane protein
MPGHFFQIESGSAALLSLIQVMVIDLVLAGDNAVAIGMAAAGLERSQRRKVIWLGLSAAVAMRIGLALIATLLLGVIGLLLAGGALLLWICWRFARDLAARTRAQAKPNDSAKPAPRLIGFRTAFLRILAADLSMSLDNVLGVAGAAHDRPMILAFGLLLSIGLTGMAASWIAKLLGRRPWLGYIGLAIMLSVAGGMLWQGHRDLVIDLGQTRAYNDHVPRALAIGKDEIVRRQGQKGLP